MRLFTRVASLSMLVAAARASAARASAARASDVLVGAIRWDDWYNTSSDPNDSGQAILRAMSKYPWQQRVPFFCTLTNSSENGVVTCNNNQQSVVDAEIEYAVSTGINYWAFDVYPLDVPLSQPLLLYTNSTTPGKAQLSFAHLLQTGWISQGGLAAWPSKVDLYVSQMVRSDYQKIEGNRPIMHLFSVYEDAWGAGTGWAAWQTAMEMYCNASVAAGLGWPYVILQDFSPVEGASFMAAVNGNRSADQLFFTALSSYACVGGTSPTGGPFQDLVDESVVFWNTCKATGADIVPVVTAGWDPRPMNETHLPWQNYTNPNYVDMPTMPELTAFVAQAMAWTRNNSARCPAGILLSAWNEFAEGHYIGPNLPQYGGDERLQAIAAGLQQ